MTGLTSILPMLSKLVPPPSSDADSEIVPAVNAINRTLRAAGLDWHDLTEAMAPARPRPAPRARPEPERPRTWQEIASWCASAPLAGMLTPKELEFVSSMVGLLRRYGQPTKKQGEWLQAIYAQLGVAQ